MNKLLECTKGPWETRPAQLGQTDADGMRDRGIGAVIGDQNYCIAEAFWRVDQLTFTPVEANAALIAAAFDHALIGWALIHADLEWGWAREGVMDWHLGGKHYPLPPYLDPFGYPILTDELRALLIAAMEGAA